jgi:hypothetical protein
LHIRARSSKNNEPIPFALTQENGSADVMTADMGLPHNAPIFFASIGKSSTDRPLTSSTSQNNQSPTPPPNRRYLAEPSLNMSNSLTYPVAEREARTRTHTQEATADATFLLKVLQLRDLDHIPTLSDLHSTLRIDPFLLNRITTALLDVSFTPETIILAASLVSRAAARRCITPIFPPGCEWYSEASTPEATLVVALRIAKLYVTQEPLDAREFYLPMGFYPYDDIANFARKFGALVFRAPIAAAIEGLELQAWGSLKKEFEKGSEHSDGDVEVRGLL